MKKLLALVLALIMAISLVACGGPSGPSGEQTQNPNPGPSESATTEVTPPDPTVTYKDTVLISANSEIQNPYCYGATSTVCSYIGNMTHESLFVLDYSGGGAIPVLAKEAVDVNGDGMVWNVKLNEGVMFHYKDAEYKEMKASDVKWTYEWAAIGDGAGVTAGVAIRTVAVMAYVDEIEVNGDYELTFHLNAPLFDFPSYCTDKILCADAMAEYGDTEGQLCGTGSYYINLDESVSGQQWVLTRYDGYWQGIEDHPTKNIVFVVHTDANTGVAALQAGEVDMRISLNATAALQFQNNPAYVVHSVPGMNIYSVLLNSYDGSGVFDGEDDADQIKLRQAISMAINRDEVVSIIYATNPSAGARQDSLWHPGNDGYKDTGKIEYNVEKAQGIMKELGYNENNVLTLKLLHYASNSTFGQIIQDQLKKIYINVELVTIESSQFGSTLRTGQGWDIALNYYTPKLTIAGTMTNTLLSTGGNAKTYGWNSAAMDAKINAIMNETSAESQLKAFQEFQVWANDYVPRIPVYVGNTMHGATAELEGFVICPNLADQDFTTLRVPE